MTEITGLSPERSLSTSAETATDTDFYQAYFKLSS